MNLDKKQMLLALDEARRALENGEFPVGCIMACGEEIIARGKRSKSRGEATNEMDHAEISALRSLLDDRPDIDPGKVTVYTTMEPCLMCYVTMLLNGIRRFVYAYEDVMGGGTNLDLEDQKPLFREMQVEVVPHLCRDESLALFKEFFSDPENDYWQDSLLEKYTLDQP
jgi:tRNA(adenine34) deaminase